MTSGRPNLFALRAMELWQKPDPIGRTSTAGRSEFSALDFLMAAVSLEVLTAVAMLLRPVFVVERDCVIWSERFERASFEEWWKELHGDRSRIEEVINHLHVWDLIDFDDGDPAANDTIDWLADVIAESWRCALAADFADRTFEVTVARGDGEYGPTVTFHSARPRG
jgi:hypothetical protein